ncbi:MAG: RNA polymerase sigma factor [bacterium]
MTIIDQEQFWVHQARKGNHRAFRNLYDLHVTPLYRFLTQFSRSHDEVADWVQRSFIKVFEHLPQFDGRSKFSTWLFTVGLNEMRMDRRRREPHSSPLENEEAALSPDDQTENFVWRESMTSWLGELEENKRMVFLLYEVEGYSHAEIASMLTIGESTSRTFLTRAKQHLKKRWNEEVEQQ